MALRIGDNFNYQGKLPNFERDTFLSLSKMKEYPVTSIDEGHISLCLEDGKRYKFSSSHSYNSTTGYWKRIVDTALDATSENPVQNKVIVANLDAYKAVLNQELLEFKNSINNKVTDIENELIGSDKITAASLSEIKETIEVTEKILAESINELRGTSVSNEITINGHPLKDGDITLTKSDIGLNNVDNTSDANKPISNLQRDALDLKVDKKTGYSLVSDINITKLDELPNNAQLTSMLGQVGDRISNHENNTNNPHQVTAAQLGLGDFVGYTPDSLPVSSPQNEELVKKVDKTTTVNGHSLSGNITLTKNDINLNNVNNTADLDKPVSIPQQEALDLKADGLITAKALSEVVELIKDNELSTAGSINEIARKVLYLETSEQERVNAATEQINQAVANLASLSPSIDENGNLIITY